MFALEGDGPDADKEVVSFAEVKVAFQDRTLGSGMSCCPCRMSSGVFVDGMKTHSDVVLACPQVSFSERMKELIAATIVEECINGEVTVPLVQEQIGNMVRQGPERIKMMLQLHSRG